MTIRRLPPTLVNRIAAGEVVERPSSAVKELVENAIDAGASRIDVVLREGGRTLIAVADDGRGMTAVELSLAVERHATSKLPDDDLSRIATLGFRGEALPSIGSVSRLAILSRARGAREANRIAVEGGAIGEPRPAALAAGTRVEVRDLFYATPARLKFLKSARSELRHAIDAVRRLALAEPAIAFSLASEDRTHLRYDAGTGDLLDADAGRPGLRVNGLLGRASVELRSRRAEAAADVEVGAEVGHERRVRLHDRQVLQLGVEALDGDVEIPVEGALDRIVHRQVEHAVRLQRWALCT